MSVLISLAKSGNEEAMMELIGIYMPMILRASRVNGIFDEDCFQEIIMKVFQAIVNFPKEFLEGEIKSPR